MAFVHGKAGRLLLGTLAYSVFLKGFERGTEVESADTTVYGSEGHNFIAGLENGTLSLDGLMDNDALAGGQDATADGALQAAAGTIITAAVEGLARGAKAFMIEARETNYAVNAPLGDAVSFNASWQSEGQVDHGVMLTDGLTAVSASADGTAVDNAASSPGGASASVHVTANTRNANVTVKVQHSVDNSVWVDLISFAVVGAGIKTSEKKAVTGTVNRYLRSQLTLAAGTGSVTAAVAAARR